MIKGQLMSHEFFMGSLYTAQKKRGLTKVILSENINYELHPSPKHLVRISIKVLCKNLLKMQKNSII